MSLEDLSGKQFGRLVVHELASSGNRERKWRCECICGRIVEVPTKSLHSGNTRSCGCMGRERAAQQMREMHTTHGCSHLPEFRIWTGILTRCTNPNDRGFENYGGR